MLRRVHVAVPRAHVAVSSPITLETLRDRAWLRVSQKIIQRTSRPEARGQLSSSDFRRRLLARVHDRRNQSRVRVVLNAGVNKLPDVTHVKLHHVSQRPTTLRLHCCD